MELEIDALFSEAQKAKIVSRNEEIPTGTLKFQMDPRFAAFFAELDAYKIAVKNESIRVKSDIRYNIWDRSNDLYPVYELISKFADGLIKAGDNIDKIMQELVEMVAKDKQNRAKEQQERHYEKVLYKRSKHLRAWQEMQKRKERERIAKIEAENKVIAEAEKAEKLKKKLDWINKYGSLKLKKGIEQGYHCQKTYVFERGRALLGQEYKLDYEGDVERKTRSCPSLSALEEVESLQKTIGNDAEIQIVWLPSGLTELYSDYEPEDPCEAIEVVFNELQGYWYKKTR